VTWQAATRIGVGVGDLVQRTRDGQAQDGYSMVGRSRGQMTLCVVCTAHKGHKESKFLSLASKPRLTVSLDLVSKPVAMVLVV
jgi:hypothetical protein